MAEVELAKMMGCGLCQNPPLISYSYMPPIATKIFNYKDVLRRLNTEDVIGDPPPVCTCTSSKYCYHPAGHIITGDLSMVENKNLRELLSKCPKYREPKSFSWKQNSTLIMDSVEDYARRWAKEEEVEIDTLSEWVKSIASLVNRRISILSATMSTRCKSVFDLPDVAAELADLHDKYVIVPADKESNNIVFVCKTHYISCLRQELGLNTSAGNPTYTCTSLSKEEILRNHETVLLSFGISTADEDLDLPKLYWIPKLHKDPYYIPKKIPIHFALE